MDIAMSSKRRFVILALVLLGTFLSVGLVHGLWTERWISRRASQEELYAEMEKVPLTLGAWDGKPADEDTMRTPIDAANNYALRRYVNRNDGAVVTMMLTRGLPGPLVLRHLPTECYPSNGFETIAEPTRYVATNPDGKPADEFYVATFKKSDVTPFAVRVYWSWSATGRWQTPERPRMAFASYPMLYKLYVTRVLPKENEAFEGSVVHDFIKELTNAMRQSFFVGNDR